MKTALYFVLALGAGIKALQAVFDAVFDALVVAGFKVQAIELTLTPSVSSK